MSLVAGVTAGAHARWRYYGNDGHSRIGIPAGGVEDVLPAGGIAAHVIIPDYSGAAEIATACPDFGMISSLYTGPGIEHGTGFRLCFVEPSRDRAGHGDNCGWPTFS